MECLQAKDKRQRRIASERGGSEVLRLSYPTVTGDTPAAIHTAALLRALVQFGEKEAAEIATATLLAAVQSGRLFDFTCYTYDVSLKIARHPTHTAVTLAVVLRDGNSPILESERTMYWDSSESIQLPKAPRRVRSPHKRAKKTEAPKQ